MTNADIGDLIAWYNPLEDGKLELMETVSTASNTELIIHYCDLIDFVESIAKNKKIGDAIIQGNIWL